MRQSRNLGTSSSQGYQKRKNVKNNSAPKEEKISKYFKLSNKDKESEQNENCSDVNNSKSDLDDFKTPKAINKVSKMVKKKSSKPISKRKTKKNNANSLRKFMETNMQEGNVNPDHLQLALALSESTYQVENPESQLNSEEKMKSFKKALEKFGFGYSKNKVAVENKKDLFEITKRCNKKSKFRYVTPILKIRTSEEREALIASKVTLIMTENNREQIKHKGEVTPDLFSEKLKQYRLNKIFQLNNLDREGLAEQFYIKGLGLGDCFYSCGVLLKDWRKIPGRELSPVGQVKEDQVNMPESNTSCSENIVENNKLIEARSISPDLFESEEEYELLTKTASHPRGNDEKDKTSTVLTEILKCDLSKSDNEETFNKATSNLGLDREILFEEKSICNDLVQLQANTKIYTEHKLFSEYTDDFKLQSNEELNCKPSFHLNDIVEEKIAFYDLSQSDSEDDTCSTHVNHNKVNIKNSSRQRYKYSLSSDDDIDEHSAKKVASFDLLKSEDEILLTQLSLRAKYSSDEYLNKKSISTEFLTNIDNRKPCSEVSSGKSLGDSISFDQANITDCVQEFLSGASTIPKESDLENNQKSEITENICNRSITETANLSFSTSLNMSQEKTVLYDFKDLNYDMETSPMLASEREDFINEDDCLITNTGAFEKDVNPLTDSVKSIANFSNYEYDVNQSHNKFEMGPNHEESNLNVTAYVIDLLSQKPQSTEKIDKTSTSSSEQISQESIYISDEELNYSSVFSTSILNHNFENLVDDEENSKSLSPLEDFFKTNPENENSGVVENLKPRKPALDDSLNEVLENISIPSNDTPEMANKDFVIKTNNVTPMPNYDQMNTPKIVKELDKFGLKPLKRVKGVKMLTYIYESTHPVVEAEDGKVVKKRRTQSPPHVNMVENLPADDDLIFERTQSKRFQSCRIPLHIVWHNFVMSNSDIRESILLYEPLQLEVLHSQLKEQGFKFNIQDLLTFLDKKCITIRTAQSQRYKNKS